MKKTGKFKLPPATHQRLNGLFGFPRQPVEQSLDLVVVEITKSGEKETREVPGGRIVRHRMS